MKNNVLVPVVDIARNTQANLDVLVNTVTPQLNTQGKIIGIPLKYQVYIDINGDMILDRITPFSSGFHIIEIGDGKGGYKLNYDVDSRRDIKKLVTNYFFKDMALDLSTTQIESVFKNNPGVICDLARLAIDYEFWTSDTDYRFRSVYKFRTQNISCPSININGLEKKPNGVKK